jgi:hypothetical protein
MAYRLGRHLYFYALILISLIFDAAGGNAAADAVRRGLNR